MKRMILLVVLASALLALSGCRFAVVESGEIRIEAATPEATPRLETPDAP